MSIEPIRDRGTNIIGWIENRGDGDITLRDKNQIILAHYKGSTDQTFNAGWQFFSEGNQIMRFLGQADNVYSNKQENLKEKSFNAPHVLNTPNGTVVTMSYTEFRQLLIDMFYLLKYVLIGIVLLVIVYGLYIAAINTWKFLTNFWQIQIIKGDLAFIWTMGICAVVAIGMVFINKLNKIKR